MVAYTSQATRAATQQIPIETMRAVAIVLLVSFHVIGADGGTGLSVGYPHMLRLFGDFFIDLRMPFFAFIAGYVYAMRPPTLPHYRAFLRGKLLRLFLPCALAAAIFAVVATALGNQFARPWEDLWQVPFVSYAHFWFLQSILVIFAVYGLLDAVLKHRYAVPVLAAVSVVSLSGFVIGSGIMSVNGTLYLLPFFMLGVVFNRHGAEIWMDAERWVLILLGVLVITALWNVKVLHETGSFSFARRDLQSLGFGMAICVLTFLCAPRWPLLERLSPYGFTIYLYHIFGTVAARKLCDAAEIGSIELRFAIGLVLGLGLPILLHQIAERVPGLSGPVLGRPGVPMRPLHRTPKVFS